MRNVIGDLVQIDCTCDSECVKDAMVRVGTAIRHSYSWIPLTEPCWLVMDNAGGHGTKECIVEYKTIYIYYLPNSTFAVHKCPRPWCLDVSPVGS